MTINMTDRKVEGKQQVTTPIRTFDCYVITDTNSLKMGAIQTNYSTLWIAIGIGMVKETLKSNRKLLTKSML